MPVGKGASASNLAGPRRSSDATLSESEARNEGSAPKPTDGKQIYRSIYAGVVREKAKKTKHERDSFGLADYRSTVAPNEWLHRGTFDKRFALLSAVKYERDRTILKAPLPTDNGVIKPPKQMNYVADNVDEIIHTAPGKVPPPPKFYTKKPSYGKQPSYLMRFKREVEEQAIQAQVKAKKDAEEALARQGFAPLPEDERQKILEGLRANLEKVTFEYGKISMVVDTIGKIRRKQSLESQMTQLDKDIALFSDRSISPENPILVNVGPEKALEIREKGWAAANVDVLG